MKTIKLWFSPFTRSTRPRWMLEELGVPYELVAVDMKARAHKAPEYIENVHPHGAVPAAEIDGEMIIESAAIISILADAYPDKHLAPLPGSKERARYNQWMFYAPVTLEPALIDVIAARKPDSTMTGDKKHDAEARWQTALSFVDKSLGNKPWILGDSFSAADCLVGSILVWANSSKLLEGHPVAQVYADRCKSRPAFNVARK